MRRERRPRLRGGASTLQGWLASPQQRWTPRELGSGSAMKVWPLPRARFHVRPVAHSGSPSRSPCPLLPPALPSPSGGCLTASPAAPTDTSSH
uniref:Uncharacterized protein n=1 Tax=Setaria viridis TaxID=4556 RepID=A0A4U6VHQ2_SETVI|nr:hypothetical protein SEVIR_3G376050v2 [Setaria viridis]